MKKNNITTIILVIAVVFMAVAFAAFATTLNINGTATISSDWNVSFVAGTCTNTTQKDSAKASTGTVSVNGTTATVVADMASPGDVLECTVTSQNLGSLPAKRNTWELTSTPSVMVKNASGEDISAYSVSITPTTNPGTVLAAKNGSTIASETLTMTITFNANAATAPTNSATFGATATYVQAQ